MWKYDCINEIKIKGNEENIVKFLNIALRNSNLEEATTISEAVERTKDCFSKCVIDDVHEDGKSSGLYMGTFLPMDEEIQLSNNGDYKKVAYYNIERFGACIDVKLRNLEYIKCDDDKYILTFGLRTPYDVPFEFIDKMASMNSELSFYTFCLEPLQEIWMYIDYDLDKYFYFEDSKYYTPFDFYDKLDFSVGIISFCREFENYVKNA